MKGEVRKMRKAMIVDVYIGDCFNYKDSNASYGCLLDNNSVRIPSSTMLESKTLENIIVRVIDFHDFYLEYMSEKIDNFKVKVYLNKKSLNKLFGYKECIDFLDKIKVNPNLFNLKSFEL